MERTKESRRIHTSALSIIFLMLLVSALVIASFVSTLSPIVARAYDPIFDGGSGTKEDPFLVSNSRHLNNVRYNLDSYFLQTDNIDASDIDNFTPIGNASIPFAGQYNGSQFIISNLKIEHPKNIGVGLFSFLTGTVDGVKLYSSTISGESNVGGLVGINKGIIKNSTNQASVSASKSNAGGIVGLNQGVVSTSSNRGNIRTSTVGFSVGGIAGTNFNDINDTYNLGNISGGTYVGGIVGSNNNQNGTASIVNSFNYGANFSGKAIGQIAGENTKSSFGYGSIEDVAWLKSQPDIAAAFGAVEIITDTDSNKTTTNTIVKNAKSLLASDFAIKSTFDTWSNFDASWEIRQNATIPTLKVEYVKAQSVEFVDGDYLELQAEQSTILKVKVNPINATLQDAVFEIVQGSTFATIDRYSGEIRINANTPVGSNIVVLASVEDVATTLQINTVKIGVVGIEQITVAENKTIISYGEVLHLSTRVLPLNSSFQDISWRTNVSFADISQDGELTLTDFNFGGDFIVTAQSIDNPDIYTTLSFETTTQGPGFVVDFDNAKEFFVVDSLTLNPKIVSSTDQIIDKDIRLEIVQGTNTNTANATLNNKTLTATQPGIVVVRAFVDSMYWEDTITVKKVPVQKVEFVNKSTMLLREANSVGLQLQTVVTPSNATYPNVSLSILQDDNTANATLDITTNILQATRVGEVTVRAIADGVSTTIKITVLPNPIEGIEFIKPFDATYDFGQDIKVYYEIYDQDNNKTVSKTLANDNKYFDYDEDNKAFTVTADAPINHTIRIIVDIYEFSKSVDFKIDFIFESDVIDKSIISDDGLFQLGNFGDKVDGIVVGENKYDLKLLKYEIVIKNGTVINFSRTITTNDAKLRLLLYKNTKLSQYNISLKMFFSQNNIYFDYTIERYFVIQKSPTAQVDDFNEKQKDLTKPYKTITSFDFYDSGSNNFSNTQSGGKINANSSLQAMYVYSNFSIEHKNINFEFDNVASDFDLYLDSLKFVANNKIVAIKSSGYSILNMFVINNVKISGGNSYDSGHEVKDRGGNGIQAINMQIQGNGNLYVYGGNGANGIGVNEKGKRRDGSDGGNGIEVNNLTIGTNISLEVYGGNGGHGVSNDPDDGNAGGSGGNGGHGIKVTQSLYSQANIKLSGGNGGKGGNGHDASGSWWLDTVKGGFGGNGGNGGHAIAKSSSTNINLQWVDTLIGGIGGHGGHGGKGYNADDGPDGTNGVD
ncbi:MAG: hypothetical protein FWF58_04290, partial [Firmicutes bacterium]|nr:hypothetical protein [Bacillota bacterium]